MQPLCLLFSDWHMLFFFNWQPILVYMSKVDGKFNFSPISVNFLTEITKVFFAIVMLLLQVKISFPLSIFKYFLSFQLLVIKACIKWKVDYGGGNGTYMIYWSKSLVNCDFTRSYCFFYCDRTSLLFCG